MDERQAVVKGLFVAGLPTGVIVGASMSSMSQAQDRRLVAQPTTPTLSCKVLEASLPGLSPIAFVPPRAFDDATEASPPDTKRINDAITQCSAASGPSF